jgi:hypothetical protein
MMNILTEEDMSDGTTDAPWHGCAKPEAQLLASILDDAAVALTETSGDPRRRSIDSWVRHEDLDSPLSLANICEALDVDVSSVRSWLLARQPGAHDQRYSFRREGEVWTVVYEGLLCRLKHRVGLSHIAQLLASPGQPVLALDLVDARSAPGGSRPWLSGDGGELLDARARGEYRARVRELTAELDTAKACGDGAEAERVQGELDFIARELARAVGLGGRCRRSASCSERARVRATRAIRSAIRQIAAHHPTLGHHLEITLRTGTFCVYLPDPRVPIEWET